MGRTLPTQIQILREEEQVWKNYRRALRQEEQSIFDHLWCYARHNAPAASMASRPLPFEAHCMSMMVGLGRELQELREQMK